MTFYEEIKLLDHALTIGKFLNIKKSWMSMSIDELKEFVENNKEKYERLKNFK